MRYVFPKRFWIFITILIFASLLISPIFAGQGILDPTSSVFDTNQIEFQQPNLFVKDVEINQNKLPDAEDLCKQGLKLQEKSLYKSHPYVAYTLLTLV